MKQYMTSFSESRPLLEISKSLTSINKIQHLKIFGFRIILNPSVSLTNFICLLFLSAFLNYIVVPINMLQFPLLGIVYYQHHSQRDDITAISQIFELFTCLFMSQIYGKLCDTYGRRPFIAYGMILICLATSIISHLPSVNPYFFFIRFLYINGYTSLIIVPLLADYIDQRTQGVVASLINITGNLGAFLSISSVQKSELFYSISSILTSFGLRSLVIGFAIILGLKEGTEEQTSHVEKERVSMHTINYSSLEFTTSHQGSESPFEGSLREEEQEEETIMIKKEAPPMIDHKLCVAFILGFIGTAQSCLLGFSLIKFVINVTGNEGATSHSYELANLSVFTGIFSSIIYGFFADFLPKWKLSLATISFSVIAEIILIRIGDPYCNLAHFSMVLFGLASSGYNILNIQLISRHSPPSYRAAINAFNTIVCTLGAGSINIVGLYLSRFSHLVPFYMHLIFSTIGVIVIIYLYVKEREIILQL